MFGKAIRRFVFSTFAAFAQARELLQGKVFLALAAYCGAKGYQFLPFAFSWGVNDARLAYSAWPLTPGAKLIGHGVDG